MHSTRWSSILANDHHRMGDRHSGPKRTICCGCREPIERPHIDPVFRSQLTLPEGRDIRRASRGGSAIARSPANCAVEIAAAPDFDREKLATWVATVPSLCRAK
jgi:hypothetical protein